jgi:hypothetical protein
MAGTHDDHGLDAEGILDLETPINDIDDETDALAMLLGADGAPSAEEAAMHLTDEP